MSVNPPKKLPTAINEPQELEDQIRLRAQELYEARGREDGQALDDWLRAEAEITGKKVKNRRLMIQAQSDNGSGSPEPFFVLPRPYHHFNRQLEFGGVRSRTGLTSCLTNAAIPTGDGQFRLLQRRLRRSKCR